jgi:hypothetical protein
LPAQLGYLAPGSVRETIYSENNFWFRFAG